LDVFFDFSRKGGSKRKPEDSELNTIPGKKLKLVQVRPMSSERPKAEAYEMRSECQECGGDWDDVFLCGPGDHCFAAGGLTNKCHLCGEEDDDDEEEEDSSGTEIKEADKKTESAPGSNKKKKFAFGGCWHCFTSPAEPNCRVMCTKHCTPNKAAACCSKCREEYDEHKARNYCDKSEKGKICLCMLS
jgi:hypothetical protein